MKRHSADNKPRPVLDQHYYCSSVGYKIKRFTPCKLVVPQQEQQILKHKAQKTTAKNANNKLPIKVNGLVPLKNLRVNLRNMKYNAELTKRFIGAKNETKVRSVVPIAVDNLDSSWTEESSESSLSDASFEDNIFDKLNAMIQNPCK